MEKLVVSEFVTPDREFEDPGGAEAVACGGWERLSDARPAGDTLILTYVPSGDGVA